MTAVQTHTPKVSILIPVYNREDFISECIQSALDQTYTDFEIVVADNASTDGTWEICRRFAEVDRRVRIFRNETNVGPVRNWLRCVSEARGEYGKILFSDDLMYPAFLEKALPYLAEPETGFVFCAVDVGVDPAQAAVEYRYGRGTVAIPSDEFMHASLLGEGILPVSPGAALFRLKDMKKALATPIDSPSFNDFDWHGAGPDLLMYLLVAREYPKVVCLHEPLAFFRIHAGSISVSAAHTIMHSRYFQARIWFARVTFGDGLVLKRLLCKAWLDQIFSQRSWTGFGQVCRSYLRQPVKINIFERAIYSLIELTRRAVFVVHHHFFGTRG